LAERTRRARERTGNRQGLRIISVRMEKGGSALTFKKKKKGLVKMNGLRCVMLKGKNAIRPDGVKRKSLGKKGGAKKKEGGWCKRCLCKERRVRRNVFEVYKKWMKVRGGERGKVAGKGEGEGKRQRGSMPEGTKAG